MQREEIVERLRTTMQQSAQQPVDWDSVTLDTDIGTLGFDSLSILDLIYDVQQEFDLEFEAEELVGVRTVGELVDFLEGQSAG
jgi:acyl carrier protein